MQEEQIREALNAHWQASAAGDADAEHDIYADDAICDYPQSGERILGRRNLQALRSHHPGKPSGFNVKRILGKGDLWITEYTITYQGRAAYTVSIMEFRDGKVVHETQYFADPFEAPAWRSQWVQQIASLVTYESNDARTGLINGRVRVGPPVRPAHYFQIAGHLARTFTSANPGQSPHSSPRTEGGKECRARRYRFICSNHRHSRQDFHNR